MKKLIAALLIVLMSALIVAGIAFASQTQDLQPAYRLMDGDEELGVVYWLDYGMLIVTNNSTLYTCGCEEDIPCNQPSITPTNIPVTPTEPPVETPTTPEPTEKPKANCGLGNGPEGADPNENACGKKTGEDNE